MITHEHISIWRESLQRLLQDWQQVFTLHLAYTTLGIILFTPLVALIGRLLLGLSDQPALADQDIAWFLLSPAGIAALVFLAGLTIAIIGFEQASLMTMGAGHAQGSHIGTYSALRSLPVAPSRLSCPPEWRSPSMSWVPTEFRVRWRFQAVR